MKREKEKEREKGGRLCHQREHVATALVLRAPALRILKEVTTRDLVYDMHRFVVLTFLGIRARGSTFSLSLSLSLSISLSLSLKHCQTPHQETAQQVRTSPRKSSLPMLSLSHVSNRTTVGVYQGAVSSQKMPTERQTRTDCKSSKRSLLGGCEWQTD